MGNQGSRAEYRNEVKTRLRDRVYEALQIYKALHGIDSDSAALSRITEMALFGFVGTLPPPVKDIQKNKPDSPR